MLRTALIAGLGLTSAFAPLGGATKMVSVRPAAAPVTMMAALTKTKPIPKQAPPKKAPPKKLVLKKAPPKKVVKKVVKRAPPKVVAKKAPPKVVAKKAPPKKVLKKTDRSKDRLAIRQKARPPPNKGAFAYGLPGNVNIIGGTELNFDPYGFLNGKSKLEVYRYRECELTHGRVGMLAAVGFIVQEKFHPLFSGVGGPAIDQIPQLPFAWWASLGFGITFCEFYRISIAFRELDGRSLKAETAIKPGYEPGQIGFDPLGFAPTDPAEFRIMQEKELAHARLGMIAAAGFLAQEAVTKDTWGTVYGFPDF